MTRDFLTVEDVNTVSFSNQGFYWHSIDISKITTGDEDLDDVKCDFCEVKRVKRTTFYEYTITVHNPLFAKAGYVVYAGTSPIRSERPTITGNKLTFSHYISYGGIPVIYLYMGIFESEETNIGNIILNDTFELTLKQLESPQTIRYKDISTERIYSTSKILNQGYNFVSTSATNHLGYVFVKLLKTDFQFQCNQTLTVGKVNKVYLGTDSDYLPDGDLVGTYTPTITVQYGDETLPVSYDGTDYYFNLDLTDKTETGKVRFKVNVEANEVLNQTSTDVALTSQYQTVSTFDSFLTAIASNDVIRLGANLTATSSISVNRSVKIIGNDKSIDLDGYQFKLKEDVEFKAENLQLNNGDTTIIQAPNTRVELTGVTFTNCTSSDYNNLGSCIFCDSEAENIDITDDFNTVLTDCTFTNNHNAILHGGQLNINKCKFHNTDPTYTDIYNSAFIYQTDGNCTILNSVFDIDYGTDYTLCTGEQSIGFSQCIFMCGTTASINGISYNELKANNFTGFFDNPQNNRSHIYAKYYYSQISTCVFTSPIPSMEDKSLCYCLGGDDMIHKVNCQVTRADSGNENTTRRISW